MSCEGLRLVLARADDTENLGRRLGERLSTGQGLALVGELGSGKTCLARGVALGLQVDDPVAVCSPTYLLAVEHPGPRPMLHLDAYFEARSRAFLLDGGLDYLAEFQGVVIIEWADRLAELVPEESLWVELRPIGGPGGGRQAIIAGRSPSAFPWLGEIAEMFPIPMNPPEPPDVGPRDR